MTAIAGWFRRQARTPLAATAGDGAEGGYGGGGGLRVLLAKGHARPVLVVVDQPAGHPLLFRVAMCDVADPKSAMSRNGAVTEATEARR